VDPERAAAIFMVIEARKHDVPFVWAYIVGGMLIAITVPDRPGTQAGRRRCRRAEGRLELSRLIGQ